MAEQIERRLRVLLMVGDVRRLEQWTGLCARHHCSVFHVIPRSDGLFRNLSPFDFDIAVLSLDRSDELSKTSRYFQEMFPRCPLISSGPQTGEKVRPEAAQETTFSSGALQPDEEASFAAVVQQIHEKEHRISRAAA